MSVVPSQTPISTSPSPRLAEPHESNTRRSLDVRQGPYFVRLAASEADRMAAFRLRFLVFNLELSEGLETAYATGHDTDEFDTFCDHLIVEDLRTENVVGTYRCHDALIDHQPSRSRLPRQAPRRTRGLSDRPFPFWPVPARHLVNRRDGRSTIFAIRQRPRPVALGHPRRLPYPPCAVRGQGHVRLR